MHRKNKKKDLFRCNDNCYDYYPCGTHTTITRALTQLKRSGFDVFPSAYGVAVVVGLMDGQEENAVVGRVDDIRHVFSIGSLLVCRSVSMRYA